MPVRAACNLAILRPTSR